MNVQVRAEYACGHESRVIVSGECDPTNVSRDLRRMIAEVTLGGEVVFNCPCGRGAAFMEILTDGKVIVRTPASAFIGEPGVRLTRRPYP